VITVEISCAVRERQISNKCENVITELEKVITELEMLLVNWMLLLNKERRSGEE